jgi:beta propeller repeat protein
MTVRRKTSLQIVLISLLAGAFFLMFITGFAAAVDGTETLITTGTVSSDQGNPAISGDYIVWDDNRHTAPQIFLYCISLGEETQVTTGSSGKTTPAIDDDHIVWAESDGTYYQIVMYFISNSTSRQITDNAWDQKNPVISGEWIVWEDYRHGVSNGDLWGYTMSNASVVPLVTESHNQLHPSLSQNRLVWDDNRNDPDYPDIYLLDLADGSETRITTDPWGQSRPFISGDRIVWQDDRAFDANLDIWMYDLGSSTESQVTGDDTDQASPVIAGDTIFWLDLRDRNPAPDIYLMNLTEGTTEERLTTDSSSVSLPSSPFTRTLATSGNRVVWQGQQGSTQDVFLFTVTPGVSESCPVADFTADPPEGGPGTTVRFSDTSSAPAGNPVTRYSWDFGDGESSVLQNPGHLFSNGGLYPVRLTVSNPLCRNMTPPADRYNITIGWPVARFTATPSSGLVPLTVVFTDQSTGSPTRWNWSFGDGSYSALRSPTHRYAAGGTFTVNLTVMNAFGTGSYESPVRALVGARETADTDIGGITILDVNGQQYLVYNKTLLPDWTFGSDTSILEFTCPAGHGFGNITFSAPGTNGFTDFPANDTIQGYISGVCFESPDIVPADFSEEIGSASSVRYRYCLPSYPLNARLTVQMYEGVLASDETLFELIARRSGYANSNGAAYTVVVSRDNFPAGGSAHWRMSVNSSWVFARDPDGHNQTFIERIADDRLTGEVLSTRFADHDPGTGLDYFEADSPHGLSTFGLSSLSGSGNPLQLITLSVTSHVNPASDNPPAESDSGMPAAGGTTTLTTAPVPTSVPTAVPSTTPPGDPGTSAKVYTNAQGIVTQATRLASSDGRAVITIGEGITAKDAAGKPLEKITVRTLAPGDLPALPSGSVYIFDGIAYEIGPDGAIFSPPASLSFSPLQPQWGHDYSIQAFDTRSGTWEDLPTVFEGSTGIVTAQVSHFSIHALFTSVRTGPPAASPTPLPTAIPREAMARPPSTAVNIFTSMMGWVAGLVARNLVLVIGAVILASAVILVIKARKKPWD